MIYQRYIKDISKIYQRYINLSNLIHMYYKKRFNMLHNCTYCDYSTTVKPNLSRHIKNKHEHNKNEMENNRAPVTMSIGESVERPPTSVFVGDDSRVISV